MAFAAIFWRLTEKPELFFLEIVEKYFLFKKLWVERNVAEAVVFVCILTMKIILKYLLMLPSSPFVEIKS